jgi:hypothetical protein
VRCRGTSLANRNPRINSAACGERDEELNIMPEMRNRYRRSAKRYPYRSHLQWIRALYGLVFCSLMIIFQGWRTLIPPATINDFVASYLSVSHGAGSVGGKRARTNMPTAGPYLFGLGSAVLFQNQGLQTVELAHQREQTRRLGGRWSSCRRGSQQPRAMPVLRHEASPWCPCVAKRKRVQHAERKGSS